MSIVAIVGRPNVGKSTLFNRLIGKRRAVTSDIPGTTRDRIFGEVTWNGREIALVDTAGIESSKDKKLGMEIQKQVAYALEASEVIVLVIDTSEEPTRDDFEALERIRKSGKPVVLAANKADRKKKVDLSRFKFKEEPVLVSAIHGAGTGDLLDEIVKKLAKETQREQREKIADIAIAGRPNAGKSSILNAIIGSERVVVSEIPGTTRDTIVEETEKGGFKFRLLDTAGIRKRGRVEQGIEKYSVLRSFQAIEESDVVLLVLDASEGITAQDTHIAGFAKEAKKGIILLVNKWDLVKGATKARAMSQLKEQFNFIPYALVHFVSAKTGEGIDDIPNKAMLVYGSRTRRLPTAKLNRIIEQAATDREPPMRKGKRPKIFYATQAAVEPPQFVIFARNAGLLHFSYMRYLENRIREAEPFDGTAIELVLREKR